MDIKQAAAAYSNIAGIGQNPPAANTHKPEETNASFAELMSQSLSDAVDSGYKAEKVSTLALMGKTDMVQLVEAVGTAEQALQTVIAIRDKIISAYQQINQMPM
jgi:flagellar hook-basal body complex protein FliE